MPVTWPLKFISFMGNLSAGLLVIPLLQILLQGDCSTAYLGGQCTTTGNIVQLTMSCLAAAFLVALSLLFKVVFYESLPWSKDLSAQAHGRMSTILLLVQVYLVILCNAVNVQQPILRLIILSSAGAAWFGAQV